MSFVNKAVGFSLKYTLKNNCLVLSDLVGHLVSRLCLEERFLKAFCPYLLLFLDCYIFQIPYIETKKETLPCYTQIRNKSAICSLPTLQSPNKIAYVMCSVFVRRSSLKQRFILWFRLPFLTGLPDPPKC